VGLPQTPGDLVRYDSKAHEFVPYLSGIWAGQLGFSKDGGWVAYLTFPENILWRSKLDGSEGLQLTSPPMIAAFPRWSPDGKQIAFMAMATDTSNWRVDLVSPDGGTPEQLRLGEGHQTDPDWSPDGNRLAFTTSEPHPSSSYIRVLDLRTHQVSTLLGSKGLGWPRWSPDGRYIVAQKSGEDSLLMLFDSTTEAWAKLASGWPPTSWSRDGKWVYFLKEGNGAILRVRVSDHSLETVVKNVPLASCVVGDFTYASVDLGPDDSPLILLGGKLGIHAVTREIYALDWEAP
jgi:Tol biopolymer transport system component